MDHAIRRPSTNCRRRRRVCRSTSRSTPACNKANGDANTAAVAKLKSQGVQVITESADTIAAFKKSTQSVRDEYTRGNPVSQALLAAATAAAGQTASK